MPLHIELEASGGIDLTTVRGVAETGVERISVGADPFGPVPGFWIGLDLTGRTRLAGALIILATFPTRHWPNRGRPSEQATASLVDDRLR